MFSETIKLVPSLDRAALGRMFSTLNQRFASVAKKFGDGMKNAFKFGGLVGVASALIAKLVNPLEKAEGIIDRILNKGDNAVTNAEEFQSDPGKLLRLEALGQAHGLDPEALRMLLGKFQGALAKESEVVAAPEKIRAKLQDTTDPALREQLMAQLAAARLAVSQGGRLRQFIGETDIAEAFFKFIQSMQKLPKTEQTVVQSEVFGERVRGKASEFLNATDFAEILSKLPSTEVLAAAAKKTSKLSDLKDLLQAVREKQDFVTKSGLVNESQVQAIDQSARLSDAADNETLKRFDTLKTASIAIQELTAKFDTFTTNFLADVAPELVAGAKELTKFSTEFLPSYQETKKFLTESFESLLKFTADVWQFLDDHFNISGAASTGTKIGDLPNEADTTSGIMDQAFIDAWSSGVAKIEVMWGEFKSSSIWRNWGK